MVVPALMPQSGTAGTGGGGNNNKKAPFAFVAVVTALVMTTGHGALRFLASKQALRPSELPEQHQKVTRTANYTTTAHSSDGGGVGGKNITTTTTTTATSSPSSSPASSSSLRASREETGTATATESRSNEKARIEQQDNNDNDNDSNSNGNGKFAFVCVTGVFEDLDLDSTMRNLVGPVRDMGYAVDLSFALQKRLGGDNGDNGDGSGVGGDPFFLPYREPYSFARASSQSKYREGIPVFVTDEETSLSETQRREMATIYEDPIGVVDGYAVPALTEKVSSALRARGEPKFSNPREIREFVGLYNVTVGSLQVYQPLINPPMNAQYVNEMAIRDGFYASNDTAKGNGSGNETSSLRLRYSAFRRIVWRAVNDVRTLDNHDRCWKAVSKRIDAVVGNAGDAENGRRSIVVIRVGEDAVLAEALNERQFLEIVESDGMDGNKNLVSTLPCRTARGHADDQIEILPTLAQAEAYLILPYKRFYENGMFNRQISTLASYLEFVFKTTPDAKRIPGHPIPYPLSVDGHVRNTTEGDGLFKDKKDKRALVCITGQLKRLELDNKMKTLIQPIRDDGYQVDVAFALSGGSALFQRRKIPQNTTGPTFADVGEVRRWLSDHEVPVISQNFTYTPNPNIPVNPQYWVHKGHSIKNKDVDPDDFVDHTERNIVANFKMTESYTRCWNDVVASGKTYDLYVRSRDDLGFSNPLDMNSLYKEGLGSRPKTMITSYFLNNGGINDRLAFVSPDSADCYFNVPYVKFYDGSHLDIAMHSTEVYFKRIYWHTDCVKNTMTKAVIPRKMFGKEFVDYGKRRRLLLHGWMYYDE